LLDPSTFYGRASDQVDEFLLEEVAPVLRQYSDSDLSGKVELLL